ncbi:MAG: radical SAM family heme chaperone HemW [Phycisphaerales bacterium]
MTDRPDIPLQQATTPAATGGNTHTGPGPLERGAIASGSSMPSFAGKAMPGGHDPVASLYIHVPFCFHKCHYCDFYSFVDTEDQQEAFVERLCEELGALHVHAGALSTIFVGGGTPSLLRPELWRRLLRVLHELFDMREFAKAGPGEFTVECNPETVTRELAETLVGGGVNRVSFGAQSFVERHLKTLERWHDPASVTAALGVVREAGIRRTSLDLIYAIPGQTLDEWASDVRTALGLGVEHLSCYNLTYEQGTAMTVRLGRGEFEPAAEDLEADMFERAADLALAAGLERYEVSNYARPGAECRHNLAYWRQSQWLAAGPSASGHVGGVRFKNTPHLPKYLASRGKGYAPVVDVEGVDTRRAMRERLMTGLRLREGVMTVMAEEADAVAPGAGARMTGLADELIRDGLLCGDDGRWRVTSRGWLLADYVARRFMNAVG